MPADIKIFTRKITVDGTVHTQTLLRSSPVQWYAYPGSEDYVDLPFQGDATSSYAVQFWFRTSNSATASNPIDLRSANNIGLMFRLNATGELRVFHNTTTINSTDTYNDGNWHHVVCSWNGATISTTVDRSALANGSDATALAPDANGRIGQQAYGATNFEYSGDLSDVLITLDSVIQWASIGNEVNASGTDGTLNGTLTAGSA